MSESDNYSVWRSSWECGTCGRSLPATIDLFYRANIAGAAVMAEGRSTEMDLPLIPASLPAAAAAAAGGGGGGPRSPPVELVLPLPDFLDCFPPPHLGRIVSGLDVLTGSLCEVAPDAVFTFRRRWKSNVSLYVNSLCCQSIY